MTTHAERQFWSDMDRYHDLVIEYERNIERIHPNSVTSKRMCGCLKYGVGWCGWAATSVDYYEHRGPRV